MLRAEKNRLEEIKARLSEEYKSFKKGNIYETSKRSDLPVLRLQIDYYVNIFHCRIIY